MSAKASHDSHAPSPGKGGDKGSSGAAGIGLFLAIWVLLLGGLALLSEWGFFRWIDVRVYIFKRYWCWKKGIPYPQPVAHARGHRGHGPTPPPVHIPLAHAVIYKRIDRWGSALAFGMLLTIAIAICLYCKIFGGHHA